MTRQMARVLGWCAVAALAVGCVPAGGEEEEDERDVQIREPGRLADAFVPREDMGAGGEGGQVGAGGTAGEGQGGEGGEAGEGGGVAGAGGAPPDLGDPDCRTLANCLQSCAQGDGDCSRMCRAAAPAESAARYDAIFMCATDNGCNNPGGGFDNACIDERCAEVVEECFGPPPPDPPPPMGDLNCEDLSSCLSQCPDGDIECRDSCYASASPEGAAAYDAAVACVDNAACDPGDVACRQGACADQLEACFGEVVVPVGDADCNTLAGCIQDCPEEDQACRNQCLNDSSPEAFNLYQAAINCLNRAADQCPPGDEECPQMICAEPIEACVGGGVQPGGMGTCEDFGDCLGECPPNTQPCVDACIEASSQLGFDQYVLLVDCINESCPEGSNPSCGLVSCEDEYVACFPNIAIPRGAAGCAGFNTCLGNCPPNDDACVNRCITAASPRGYDLFLNAINCIQDAGCADGDAACQQANCGNQITACLNDP